MTRIVLGFLSVLAVLIFPLAPVASQEAASEDPAHAAFLDRASEASLSLDDVGSGWQTNYHYTFFSEPAGLVISDALFSSPGDQLTYLYNTVFVGESAAVDQAYALLWTTFARSGESVVDGPPIGTDWAWIGPKLDAAPPTPASRTEKPFLTVDFGVMFEAPGGVGTVVLRGEPERFTQADVVPLALMVAERLGWAPDE